jgi:hypothetical protein
VNNEETSNVDPLVSRLRGEAHSFVPDLPPGLHGRLASAIAAAPEPARPRSWPIHWWMTAALATAAVALMVFLLRDRSPVRPPVVQIPPATRWAAAPGLPLRTNPVTLARQWVEKPLQDEVNTLKNQLTSAGDTLMSSLPATPKQMRLKAL